MPAATEPTLATTSPADLALVRAIRAWGSTDPDGNPFGFLAKFAPEYRERIIDIWFSIARVTPELAWQTLLRDHVAAARFDPRRVHPSWFERILAAESPAVRALVLQRAADPIRIPLASQLKSGAQRLPPVASFASEAAIDWAMTLWSERLVGDVPESPDDPPVIMALSQFSIRELFGLARFLGQVKFAFTLEGMGPKPADEAGVRTTTSDRVRIGFLRRMIGQPDPRLIPIARADFASIPSEPRRKYAAVGLLTVARLLKACDPHRARWAIQHIPYPVAKRLGVLGTSEIPGARTLPLRAIRAWEAWIFEAAWARMLSEDRLAAVGGRTEP